MHNSARPEVDLKALASSACCESDRSSDRRGDESSRTILLSSTWDRSARNSSLVCWINGKRRRRDFYTSTWRWLGTKAGARVGFLRSDSDCGFGAGREQFSRACGLEKFRSSSSTLRQ